MKKAIFTLVCVLLALAMLVRVSSSVTYDPWVDLDESGDVDIFDVVTLAGSYQTAGDPTKNVNVTNWPVSTDVNVWWHLALGAGGAVMSDSYPAAGFGQLHVLVRIFDLAADESLALDILGLLPNAEHNSAYAITAYTATLTQTSNSRDITIAVPSEFFAFRAYADPVTSCTVYLSFYLTWS